ncbi:MAG: type I restriction-modification system subunit M [Thiothrix sp.]|nr:type I restriction-modification system subunit M [Thiothrix sp.]HPQ95227.1 type I restriction-modification system subunit M [Thiolinea sp.]
MAIKKSELYASLWSSCDELRGGMDASQYKDYILVLLFIKYVSDKYTGSPYDPVKVPAGSRFSDMVALKGRSSIGDDINKKIIKPLADANKLSNMPDFNDPEKLGSGKEMVDKLTSLIAIFENPALNFGQNRADGDDILGDAYEYLMRHFATESGKSKGQFYTPAEVSRVVARIIGIHAAETTGSTTVYDPTCGSGSLLLKVADQAQTAISLFGQEKDAATSALARMNMILHNNATAVVRQGNTLANPLFIDYNRLQRFDYVVANPPFSDKRWNNGVHTGNDPYERFDDYGIPPDKNGDYAYLLHIIASLKSRGKGACILPHGVLFRGNAEAVIREALIRQGLIRGIVGLPANLFYGTGIPACIILIDKEDAHTRKGIFMLDASKGFMKDGPKNRLREMDMHRIVDVFNKRTEVDGYSRMVSHDEIEKNEFNLNIPRYIDSSEAEDLQDIEAHLLGGIPNRDVAALRDYWEVLPGIRSSLFQVAERSDHYNTLLVDKDAIRSAIFEHAEFVAYMADMAQVFAAWQKATTTRLKALEPGFHPKPLIEEVSESLLAAYGGKALIDPYDMYQYLMNYWAEVMQDDCYLIAAEGWWADTYRILVKNAKGKEVDKGWTCDLVPKALVIARYFKEDQEAIDALKAELDSIQSEKTGMEEEHGGEEGFFAEFEKVNKAAVSARLKDIKSDADTKEEQAVLRQYLKLLDSEAVRKKAIKEAETVLDNALLEQYPELTEGQIKQLVVDDKWMASIAADVRGEMDRISQRLAQRVRELAERYESPLPVLTQQMVDAEAAVSAHLAKMGFVWQ